MHRIFLLAATLGGLTALTAFGATAAPTAAALHPDSARSNVTQVDYYWHHHHWHHRHWDHDHWHYYD